MSKIITSLILLFQSGQKMVASREVRTAIKFVPHVGDEVEIFETETKTIVSKVEAKNCSCAPSG